MATLLNIEQLMRARAGNAASLPLDLSASNVEVIDFRLSENDPLILPKSIGSSTFVNDTSAQASQTFSDSKTTTKQISISVAKGVTNGSTISASLQMPGGFTLGGNSTRNVTLSRTGVDSSTESQTWNWNANIPVPARSRVEANVTVFEADYEAEYFGLVKLSGRVFFRSSARVWGYDYGTFFLDYPHLDVTVLSDHTIMARVAGTLRAIHGLRYEVRAEQFNLETGERIAEAIVVPH